MILLNSGACLADVFSFIRKVHPQRALNALNLWLSYNYSNLFNTYYHRGNPLALAVESFAGCSLRCPECPAGVGRLGRKPGAMDMDLFRKVVDEAQPSLFYLAFHFLGEPFLNPQLIPMLKYAASKSFYTEIHTNGQSMQDLDLNALLDSGLDRLRFSVDGSSQESYEKYRHGGNLDRIVSITRAISELKQEKRSRKPLLIWQCIVFRHNEGERREMIDLARRSGADAVDFKTAWVADPSADESLLPRNSNLTRYASASAGGSCWKPWHSAVISREGEIIPCCFDKGLETVGGNLNDKGLNELWHSQSYDRIRRQAFRREFSYCQNCGNT